MNARNHNAQNVSWSSSQIF